MCRASLLVFLLLASPLRAAEPLESGDRVLLLGDDLTQQMFFGRAAATCLMALQPTAELRFFNGGKDGSTAGDALTWSEPLIEKVRPTVVVIGFGLNDAVTHEVDQYELELSNLIVQVSTHPSVRTVILLSPPALPKQTGPKLVAFSDVCARVARTEHVRFVDIYTPMRKIYDAADRDLMKQLTLGDRMPGEPMHVVIASHLLKALGVTGDDAMSVSWSPLTPVQMGEVRSHLVWKDTQPPAMDDAAASRRLYLTLTACDELFFRLWRLDTAPQDNLEQQWAEAWASADRLATALTPPPKD